MVKTGYLYCCIRNALRIDMRRTNKIVWLHQHLFKNGCSYSVLTKVVDQEVYESQTYNKPSWTFENPHRVMSCVKFCNCESANLLENTKGRTFYTYSISIEFKLSRKFFNYLLSEVLCKRLFKRSAFQSDFPAYMLCTDKTYLNNNIFSIDTILKSWQQQIHKLYVHMHSENSSLIMFRRVLQRMPPFGYEELDIVDKSHG